MTYTEAPSVYRGQAGKPILGSLTQGQPQFNTGTLGINIFKQVGPQDPLMGFVHKMGSWGPSLTLYEPLNTPKWHISHTDLSYS